MDATRTHPLNVEILNAQIAKEAWYNTFWSKISGNISITETNGIKQRMTAPNSAIQIMTEFIDEGRDNMLMPMLLDLTEVGVYGDSPLLGTGEEMALKYLRVYVNQYSKAVIKKTGNMAEQRLKMYDFMQRAKPALVKHFAKWFNQEIFQSFYEGVSSHISAPLADGGLGMYCRWHPNQYGLTAAGTLTTAGTAGYIKTAAEVGTLADGCDTVVEYKTFHALRALNDTTLLIEPLMIEGGDPFWLFIVDPFTYNLILQDTNIASAQNAVFTSKMREHPLFTGREFMYYNGFAIIKDPIGIRTIDTSDSSGTDAELFTDLAAGNSDYAKGWLNPCTPASGLASGCLLVGANAIGKGIAEDLHFTSEEIDHKRTIEIGGAVINGCNRADYFNATDEALVFVGGLSAKTSYATAKACKNQSSAIIWLANAAA